MREGRHSLKEKKSESVKVEKFVDFTLDMDAVGISGCRQTFLLTISLAAKAMKTVLPVEED